MLITTVLRRALVARKVVVKISLAVLRANNVIQIHTVKILVLSHVWIVQLGRLQKQVVVNVYRVKLVCIVTKLDNLVNLAKPVNSVKVVRSQRHVHHVTKANTKMKKGKRLVYHAFLENTMISMPRLR